MRRTDPDKSIIVKGIIEGEDEAYEALLEMCGARIIAAVRRLLPAHVTHITPEDCLQEAVLRLVERRKELTFETWEQIAGWLRRVACCYCIDKVRSETVRMRLRSQLLGEQTWLELLSRDLTGDDGIHVARTTVRQLLAQLGPEDRWLLFLTYFTSLKSHEIARHLEMTPGQVRTRRHRLLRRLREGI